MYTATITIQGDGRVWTATMHRRDAAEILRLFSDMIAALQAHHPGYFIVEIVEEGTP